MLDSGARHLTTAEVLLAACMFFGAILYSSVGHAGASAYLALMALFGLPPAVMRPTALVLNILVASLASVRYFRAELFRWRTLWPFLAGAMPFALLGGALQIPGDVYRPLVGAVLWIAAARLLWPREIKAASDPHDPPVVPGRDHSRHPLPQRDRSQGARPRRGHRRLQADGPFLKP